MWQSVDEHLVIRLLRIANFTLECGTLEGDEMVRTWSV